jgi:hypothetical protein
MTSAPSSSLRPGLGAMVVLLISLAAPQWAVAADGVFELALAATARGLVDPTGPSDIVVEKDELRARLSGEAGGFRIVALDRRGLRERFRKSGRVRVYRGSHSAEQGDVLTVNISYWWYSHHRRFLRPSRDEFALEGGTTVDLRCSGVPKSCVIAKITPWGV